MRALPKTLGAWASYTALALSAASLSACATYTTTVVATSEVIGYEVEPLPAWLPPYSSADLALLEPVEHDIDVRAPRVYPDLKGFGYSDDRPLVDPRNAMRLDALVSEVLDASPRFYLLGRAPRETANLVAQYGPTAPEEPDPWVVAKRDERGIGELLHPRVNAAAKLSYARGVAQFETDDLESALASFREAVNLGPNVPGFRLGLAEALFKSRNLRAAKAAYEDVLAVDPTLASAHLGLAKTRLALRDRAGARAEVAEALAYRPGWLRALEVADQVVPGAGGDGDVRLPPYRVFLEVDAKGAVHVLSEDGDAARAYGMCRAALRYEPDMRAATLGVPRDAPYHLSVAEEVLCHEAAIGAYLAAREDDRELPVDPRAEALLDLAARRGLSGFVMYEVLGAERPERARLAPPAVHEAMLRYVEDYILGPETISSAPPPVEDDR